MDQSKDQKSANLSRRTKKSLFTKIITVSAAVIVVFGAGLAIGKGDVKIAGLSQAQTLSPNSYQLDYSSVEQVYSLLKQDFDGQLNTDNLLDGIKAGLASATGDPYTEYFNAKEAKEFNEALNGSFTGIGAELGTNADKNVIVVSPLSGYPAEKAGMRPRDIIAAVNGQPTSGMSVDAVVKKIRGPEGTKVTLTIVRGDGKPFELNITRTQITVPSVKTEVINGIGYMKINQFTSDTAELARKAAEDYKSKNVKAVVVDLRGNPGGFLNGAVEVSSLWLDKGQTVVSERRGTTIVNTHYATGDENILKGMKTVVLINGGSASASEIMAGALRDNKAATIVGEQSFGKGSVQKVEQLFGGAEIKITAAHWYTPAGKTIDKTGIKPDIEVKLTDADISAGKDPQKDKAFALAAVAN